MSTTSWLCRLSSNGDTLWTRVYPGKDELAFEAMNRSIDGALLLAGWSYDRPEPMVNDSIVSWVCKLDQNLDTLWYKEFKPATFTFFETMSVGPSGEILLGGRYGDAQSVTWLTKLDPNGDLLWSKTYSQAEIYPIGSISPTNNGGYVLTGRSQGLFIMTIDGSGNQILYKKYIEGSSGYSIIQTADQGFLVGGNTSEMWLLKTDRHGRVQYTD